MIKACYPGSFDPITNGHMDIIARASRLFDEVYVVIMHNPRKQCIFTEEERVSLIERSVKAAGFDNVKVLAGTGLSVDFAQSLGCKVMIRGIRAVSDYEFELQQATANMELNHEVETVFFIARPNFSFLASSVVKEIAEYGGDIDGMVPDVIKDEVMDKMKDFQTL